MGMSIDDNVDFLNDAKKLFEDIANDPSINETIKTYFIIESLESAIGIMHKYQKIEDIYYHQTGQALENSLRAVVEDGNVDWHWWFS